MNYSRYTTQMSLDGFGVDGQKKLQNSTVAVIGCGGLGSIAAPYLAGAGLGRIVLIDGDEIEITNLHRQVIYSENDHSNKAKTLGKHLENLNSEIEIIKYCTNINQDNAHELLKDVDFILECTDSAETKYKIDDLSEKLKIPIVIGAIGHYIGYLISYNRSDPFSPCLKDFFPNLNKINTCTQLGVFNTTAGIIGLLQANVCLIHLLGINEIRNEILIYNAKNISFQKMKLHSKNII